MLFDANSQGMSSAADIAASQFDNSYGLIDLNQHLLFPMNGKYICIKCALHIYHTVCMHHICCYTLLHLMYTVPQVMHTASA